MTGTVKEDVGFVQDGSDAVSSADGGSMIIPYKDRYWWKEAIVYQVSGHGHEVKARLRCAARRHQAQAQAQGGPNHLCRLI